MTTITFIEFNGRQHEIEAVDGQSLMRAAMTNNVPGIDAECGGACVCATCHVYVDDAWREHVGEAGPTEKDLLDFATDVQDNSRLSCQIVVSRAMQGLVVKMPQAQG